MKLGDLEGANTKRKYKGRDGESLVNIFKYWQPFALHFHSRHQVDNHNNRSHSPMSLDRKCATKFFPDHNFAWYLPVIEVKTALVSGHFQMVSILCLL